jgi:hypothetical protein
LLRFHEVLGHGFSSDQLSGGAQARAGGEKNNIFSNSLLRFLEVLGRGVSGSDQPGGGAQAQAGGEKNTIFKIPS